LFIQEVIELMVASLYTNSRPYEEPHNHLVGFLRFLHLLQNHNWEDEALVVDIDGEFDQDDYQQIHATYERLRGLQVGQSTSSILSMVGVVHTDQSTRGRPRSEATSSRRPLFSSPHPLTSTAD